MVGSLKPSAPFACRQCGKTFDIRCNWIAHERVHSGAMPFTCPHCNRKFKWQSSLKAHDPGCIRKARVAPSPRLRCPQPPPATTPHLPPQDIGVMGVPKLDINVDPVDQDESRFVDGKRTPFTPEHARAVMNLILETGPLVSPAPVDSAGHIQESLGLRSVYLPLAVTPELDRWSADYGEMERERDGKETFTGMDLIGI